MGYKNNTKGFIKMINNGWLHNPKDSIDKVYKRINKMVLNKENTSKSFNIFHANLVKTFIEETSSKGIEVVILDKKVCSTIKININIVYDELSASEYSNLRKTIKNYK